jgi:EAL domain-containing protein (putative c-di-GMP-specific phosphodiesterase class I)/CheY-like chemotaxis protein
MSEKKILVVDDDDDVRVVVRAILASAGYDSLDAVNGSEGVERAVSERPDLVLLDVMMPNLSGWEVCATVKSEIRDFVAGRQAGADDFVTKPFTKARLLEAVATALAGRDGTRTEPSGPDVSDLRARGLLLDGLSGLPTVPVVVDALREKLLVDQDLGVLLIDVEAAGPLEDHYGWEVLDEIVRETAKGLRRLVGTLFSTGDVLAVSRPGGSALVAFVALPAGRDEKEASRRLAGKARQLEETLAAVLGDQFIGRIHRRLEVSVAASRLRYDPQVRIERLVYRAIGEAAAAASSREERRAAAQREEFVSILRRKAIETVFQPIRSLATGRVVAWEALSRGPVGTGFESPEVLFEYAAKQGEVLNLEGLCCALSAKRFGSRNGGLLFVNVETDVVNDLARGGLEVLSPLVALGHSVVLEITERGVIPDFEAFRQGVAVLRRSGFRVALDDAGSGHASLHALAELRPDFLKISQSLVTGLHRDGIKNEIVEMLVKLAGRTGAVTIAEGIETEEELAAVKTAGVALGQGFLLGPPAAQPAT